MLLEFSCSNHKSIRESVLFSTLASTDHAHEERVYSTAGIKVLKAAVIYGANGSGKSNFINAISFMKDLVIRSINLQPGQNIPHFPHKLEGFSKESSYKIQFITKGVRYVFGFTLKNTLISEEYLYYFPNNKQTKIFEREGEKFTAGSKFRGRFSACKEVLKPNRLMLSCAANFSQVNETLAAFRFFDNELVIYGPSSQENWMHYSLHQMNRDPKIKAVVKAFLQGLGTGVKDIEISIDQKKMSPQELPPFLSDEFKALLMQQNADAITARVKYENFETDLFLEESAGIRKLFAILCPLIDILAHGKVLLCDELEANFHEALLYGLIRQFMETESRNFAQLIFTTHETGLLNLDLFRRDQIWFTELTATRSTDLYSLAEIKNVRKEENFSRGYISGKYGAIPMLNLNFGRIIAQMQEGI